MRHKTHLFWITIVLLASSLFNGQAQDTMAPVIVVDKGILYRWTSTEGLVEVIALPEEYDRLRVAPTSDRVIIISKTPEVLQTIEEECPCGGAYWATNFTSINMMTGESILVATQAEGTQTFEQIQRSLPVFSPDGTQVAWMEGSEISSLMVFDFATGETQTVAEGIQSQFRVSQPAIITDWTSVGIFVEQVVFDAAEDYHDGYAVYNAAGELIVDTPSLDTELSGTGYWIPSVPPINFGLRNNGYFIAAYQDSNVIITESEIYSISNDTLRQVDGGTIYFTAATYPNIENTIYMSPPIIREDGKRTFDIYQGGEVVQQSTSLPLLSPDGQAVLIDAGLHENGLQFTLWQADTVESELVMLSVFPDFIDWGGYSYVWEPNDGHLNLIGTCEGQDLPFNLRDNSRGHVLVDANASPNNLRDNSSVNGEIIGQVDAGDFFDVIQGPECHDGIAWWMVNHPNGMGWMAAGIGDTYFVAPGCGNTNCARG